VLSVTAPPPPSSRSYVYVVVLSSQKSLLGSLECLLDLRGDQVVVGKQEPGWDTTFLGSWDK
jgi:hypothetical protein